MFSSSDKSKQRDVTLSALDGIIQVLSVVKDGCGVPSARIALGSACVLLTTIKVRPPSSLTRSSRFTFSQDTMSNKDDYVDLGLSCAEVCKVLEQGLKGVKPEDLNETVAGAIDWLKA